MRTADLINQTYAKSAPGPRSRAEVAHPRTRGELGLIVLMLAGSIVLFAVPLGWLYLGSQLAGSTHSLGLGIFATIAGAGASIAATGATLVRLNRRHKTLVLERGGRLPAHSLLEVVVITGTALAVVFLGIWFFAYGTPVA